MCGYRPRNSNPKKFMKECNTILGKLKELKFHEIIIGMDHNFDLLKSASNNATNQFLDMHIDRNLTPCITKPTRVTNKTATLIDNILVSNRLHYNYTPFVVTDDLSDHYPILVVLLNIQKCKKDKVRITSRKTDSETVDQIKAQLDTVDWMCMNTMNVNESFEFFHSTLTNIIDTQCPKREFSVRYDRITRDPWITKGLTNSLQRQKKVYLKQLHSDDLECRNTYKTYRNVLRKLLRHSKLTYFKTK